MINLKNKVWPSSPIKAENLTPEEIQQFLKVRADYEKSAFVSEGHVEVRILGTKSFTDPIPPQECAISSLVAGPKGKIYGGTAGKKAHFFLYDPSPDADTVLDIGVVGENMAVSSLACDSKGTVYGSTDGEAVEGLLFVYKSCEVLASEMDYTNKGAREIFDTPVADQVFHSIVDPCHAVGRIEILASPIPNEGIASLVMDETRHILYGLTSKSGTFFIYDLDSNKVIHKEPVDELKFFSPSLAIDSNGVVYGACGSGRLFRYMPDNNALEKLELFAPSLKGRELYNRVEAWAYDRIHNILYGGTIDGIVFSLNLATMTITCLGKPIDQSNIRTLTLSNDGRLYGVGGEEGKCCHLFVYDPATRDLKDLGCMLARVERPWYGYEFASSATGCDGRLYFGEFDRISHLFLFFPPIQPMSDSLSIQNLSQFKSQE
jgi:hypothetical protein